MTTLKKKLQVESVIGVAVFTIFSLFHFCAIDVDCPDSKVEQYAFVFYTTYVKGKGNEESLI